MRKSLLFIECIALIIALPFVLWATADRAIMLAALWGGGLLAFIWLRKFNWRVVWQGNGITPAFKHFLFKRFFALTLGAAALTAYLMPERLLAFPLQRPQTWLMVMLLYPVLSALPQEIIYRAFFFKRYEGVVKSVAVLATLSAIGFGLTHWMMNNWVAPVLSIFGGLLFAHTYHRTQSLKWAFIEHAAYGCMIFTMGLGWYFYLGNWR